MSNSLNSHVHEVCFLETHASSSNTELSRRKSVFRKIGLVAAGATWAFGRHFSFDPLLASKNLPSISLTVVFDSLLKNSDFFEHHFAPDGSFFEKAS